MSQSFPYASLNDDRAELVDEKTKLLAEQLDLDTRSTAITAEVAVIDTKVAEIDNVLASINAIPTLSSISPVTAEVEQADTLLTVNGTGFFDNGGGDQTLVYLNDVAVTTAFVSATQVTCTIPAALMSTQGSVKVHLVSPAPGGGTSGSLLVPVNYPTPALTLLTPSTVASGATGQTITLTGTGFYSASEVRVNGLAVGGVTFVDATQLDLLIADATIANPGSVSILVHNPTPGGGTTGAEILTVT